MFAVVITGMTLCRNLAAFAPWATNTQCFFELLLATCGVTDRCKDTIQSGLHARMIGNAGGTSRVILHDFNGVVHNVLLQTLTTFDIVANVVNSGGFKL